MGLCPSSDADKALAVLEGPEGTGIGYDRSCVTRERNFQDSMDREGFMLVKSNPV